MSFHDADPQHQLSESSHHLQELSSALTVQNTAIHPYLKGINALQLRAVMTARAAIGDQVVKPYTVNQPIAPGKKNETQPSFILPAKSQGESVKGIS